MFTPLERAESRERRLIELLTRIEDCLADTTVTQPGNVRSNALEAFTELRRALVSFDLWESR